MKNTKWIQTLVVCLSMVGMALGYQNCGGASGSGGEVAGSASLDSDVVAIPNTKTASVQRASRALDNLVACMGVGEADNDSVNAFRNNRGTISEEGYATTMTQPMAKAMVTISAEVCEHLMNRERNMSVEERKMFIEIDFNDGGLTRRDLILGTKRMARSCWGRNASDTELGLIVDDTTSAFSGDDDNQTKTRNMIVYMCTAMASSFATYEM